MKKEDMDKIDPWGRTEIKDYGKLKKEFGVEEFSKVLPQVKTPSLYMKREVIFGHRDFGKINEAINKKKKFAMLTGLMPSGEFHFGHKLVADQMVYYQNLGAECFVIAADLEAYLTRDMPLEKGREIAINEYLLNYIALGLKPQKCTFYFQSEGSKEYNKLSKIVSKRTTFNEFAAIYGEPSPSKMTAVFAQVADILYPQLEESGGPKPTVVPVGADQLPHINFTRDIASRMQSEYRFVLPSATFHMLVPGLGGGKMSSSVPESYISFKDSPEIVKKKIMKYAFSGGQSTIEEHRKVGGRTEMDVSYQLLRMMFEDSDAKLKKICDEYESGKLLTGELKQILVDKVNKFLEEHNKKRKKAEKLVDKFID